MSDNMPADSGASGGKAGNTTTTPSGAPTSPPPSTPPEPGSGDQVVSNPEAKRYADEAAAERTARKKLEAELKKFQDAQLTDSEKRERDFTELQTVKLELETRNQQLSLENAGLRLAPSLGIADPAAALALVMAEHRNDLKYGDNGNPENLSDLLKTVLKDHPLLAGKPAASNTQPNSGGPTNPGRQAGNGGLTLDEIKRMPMRERMARMAEIKAWEDAQTQS